MKWFRSHSPGLAVPVMAGLAAMLFVAGLVAETLPFVDNFEGRAQGILDGQGDWLGLPDTNVQVQTSTVYAGDRAMVVGRNSLAQMVSSTPNATNVWIDFAAYVQPHPFNLQPRLREDSVSGFYFNSFGNIVAWSNNTWVTLSAYTVPTNAWQRFTINLNYKTREWGIYIAGSTPNTFATPVATNLAFNISVTNAYFKKFTIRN